VPGIPRVEVGVDGRVVDVVDVDVVVAGVVDGVDVGSRTRRSTRSLPSS
jgi:hypothetical protein